MALMRQFARTRDGATVPSPLRTRSPDLGHKCARPRLTPGQGPDRRGKDDFRRLVAPCLELTRGEGGVLAQEILQHYSLS